MSRTTVLIVEDEAIVAADLAGKLGRLGYEVAGIAAEGEEAVALACRLRPDLLLVDIRLDDAMDGIEAVEAIHLRHDVPVVYLTAHSDAATLARAKLSGPFGFILKPFDERDLATQIELALYKHQADRQIREQREWLRVTLTSIGDAVIATDGAARITFLNPVAEMLTGWKAEEAVGQPLPSVFSVVDEQTGQTLDEPVTQVLRDGRPVALANHAALVAKDGRTIPIDDSAAPILDAQGDVIGVVLVFHDVTEKRRAEEALRATQEDLIHAQVVGQIGSWRLNVHRNELLWSDENYRIFGIPKGTPLTFETFLGTVHPDDREYVQEKWAAALQGDPYDIEHRIVLGDTVKWVRERAGREFDEQGLLLGGFGTAQDITERKKHEEELLNLNRALRALSSANQAMIHGEDESDLLGDVCRIVVEDCGYPMVWVGFSEQDESKTIRPVAQAGFEEGYLESIQITWADTEAGRGPTGTAVRTGILDICHDMQTEPRMRPWREQALKRGYASSISLPLRADGRILGALTIYASEPDRFPVGEVKLLAELADNLAHGITVIRMRLARQQAEAALLQSEARFRLLSETAGGLLAVADPQELVNDACRRVMEHLDCQTFFNFLADEQAGRLHLNACAGIPDEEARKIEWLDYGVAVCGCVAREGGRIVAEDIFNVPDVRTELVKSYGIQAYACHPLKAGGRVIGTLSFGTKTRSRFLPHDLELMKTVTDQVAVAMERMRLIGELERSRDELEMRVRSRTAELAAANTELSEAARALKDSESRLRKNNELLQKVFDGITDPLIMLDGEGLVSMLNKAARNYYDVGEEADVFGKFCFQGLRGRETACPGCAHPFVSVGDQTVSFERQGLFDPGRIEKVTVYPVLDEHGKRESVIVRSRDVTQAKILERQILQNEKLAALGLVTSGIAHEINNPNTFIYFNLPILRSYLEELMPIVDEHAALHPEFELFHMSYGELREDIFKLIENMEHGSQRINKIVGVLKGFLRKRDSEGVQKVDLKQLVDKVLALCHTELRHKLSSFEVVAPGELPPIVSDPEALEQVLINLLINAIHACDKPDCHVSLKVEHRLGTGEFILEVTDNGSGIEDAVLERIFDPFFTTKSPTLGTGLGLYICHNHVTSLGGRIEVESKVGQGTTFRIVLPQTGKTRVDNTRSSQVR